MMRALIFLGALLFPALALANEACPGNPDALGPARTLEVETKGGGAYGTLQYPRTLGLAPKEIVFTFDDGPDPEVTPRILDTLDKHCLKAAFFFTGLRAERYPELVREAARRGHTIATHTYSHPNNLRRLSQSAAISQIERGRTRIDAALKGAPDTDHLRAAPFFRFPGLNDSPALLNWLEERNIATFSADFGSDDWRRLSAASVYQRTLKNADYVGHGILIMHDTKPRAAAALPLILKELARRGYSAAHIVPAKKPQNFAAHE